MNGTESCPRCGHPLHHHEPMNALSRRDNETYICSRCGLMEAMEDERMLGSGRNRIPNPKGLPAYCYHHNHDPGKPETVLLSYGMEGFIPLSGPMKNVDYKELNGRIKVTEEQADLMLMGSMYGFRCPDLQEGSS